MRVAILSLFFAILGAQGIMAQTEWIARYNGPLNLSEEAFALVVDTSGNVYVTGVSDQGVGIDNYATIRYSTIGDTVWVRRYNGPGNGIDIAHALAVDTSGNVYVSGYSDGDTIAAPNYDYATIKYDSNGDTVWVRRYNGSGNGHDLAHALAVDLSGNVYVTGESVGSGTGEDYVTIKYNSIGDTLWVRRFDGPVNGEDRARALAVDPSGNVVVTGWTQGSGTGLDYTTIQYNSIGDTLWVRSYNGPVNMNDEAFALAVDDSGNVVVTGRSWNGTDYDYATIKYSSIGDTVWVRRYNGSGNGWDEALALAVDPAGNVYVTGFSDGDTSATNFDYATIKYNSNGDSLWVRRYNGSGNGQDFARALAVDPSGNVYVTGESVGSGTGNDYVTIKYNSIGDILWVRRYNNTIGNPDRANALAVDPSGNVVVTGGSGGSGTDFDYATLKYCRQQDLRTLSLLAPSDTVFTDSTYSPQAWVQNLGVCGMTFDAISTIDGYVDTQQVVSLAPGDSTLVTFSPWMVPPLDSTFYTMTVCSKVNGADEDTTNDCAQKSIFAYNPVGVEEENSELRTPNFEFRLLQNHPNPFHSSTMIRYQVPTVRSVVARNEAIPLRLAVYDITGSLIETLVDKRQEPGVYQVEWKSEDAPSGIYFYRLTVEELDKSSPYTTTRKMILLR